MKTRKNNTKWFYIMTAVMALIFYLDGFGNEKYETVVYLISAVWFISFGFLSEYFDWGNKGLVLCREIIARHNKELKKHGLIAFLNPDTNGLTISKKGDDNFYDFEKLLDEETAIASSEKTKKIIDKLGRKIKKIDEDKSSDLKMPIELVSGIYEDSGAVAIAKTKGGGVRSVSWDYQKKEWEPTTQSVGSIMRQKPASAFDKERYGIKLTKEDKEELKLKTEGIITTHDFFDKEGDVIYSKEVKTSKGTYVKLEIKISKKDFTILQMKGIQNDIWIYVRQNPLDCFDRLRKEIIRLNVPYSIKYPFSEHKGYRILVGKGDVIKQNLYEDSKGNISKMTKEMIDWKIYTGVGIKNNNKKIIN
ncbi:hypothetical protein N8868_04140 [Candidatus Pelagibacter ubique]|nr:hypothetical protein [Candidatus Pelagibacter ubique]